MYLIYTGITSWMTQIYNKNSLSFVMIKWKTKQKCHTVRTVPKSNRNIVEIEAEYVPLTHIYQTAHFHGLAKSGEIKLISLTEISPLSEMMR